LTAINREQNWHRSTSEKARERERERERWNSCGSHTRRQIKLRHRGGKGSKKNSPRLDEAHLHTSRPDSETLFLLIKARRTNEATSCAALLLARRSARAGPKTTRESREITSFAPKSMQVRGRERAKCYKIIQAQNNFFAFPLNSLCPTRGIVRTQFQFCIHSLIPSIPLSSPSPSSLTSRGNFCYSVCASAAINRLSTIPMGCSPFSPRRERREAISPSV